MGYPRNHPFWHLPPLSRLLWGFGPYLAPIDHICPYTAQKGIFGRNTRIWPKYPKYPDLAEIPGFGRNTRIWPYPAIYPKYGPNTPNMAQIPLYMLYIPYIRPLGPWDPPNTPKYRYFLDSTVVGPLGTPLGTPLPAGPHSSISVYRAIFTEAGHQGTPGDPQGGPNMTPFGPSP
jgi:hypothetical protein